MDAQEQNRQLPDPQQDELENEYLSSLDRLAAGLSPEKWKLWQTIAGGVGHRRRAVLVLSRRYGNLWFHGAGAGGGDPAADPQYLAAEYCPKPYPGTDGFHYCLCGSAFGASASVFPGIRQTKKWPAGRFFVCLPGCCSRPSPGGAAAFCRGLRPPAKPKQGRGPLGSRPCFVRALRARRPPGGRPGAAAYASKNA